MKKITDIISKYQQYFLGFAIFLTLLAVSITITDGKIHLNLIEHPLTMLFLVVSGIVLALTYITIDKRKILALSNQIKEALKENNNENQTLVNNLTSRQKEVYNLIIIGKSNKEIMADLFIEQSTLKSHINQIYKKLKLNSRKELKTRVKAT